MRHHPGAQRLIGQHPQSENRNQTEQTGQFAGQPTTVSLYDSNEYDDECSNINNSRQESPSRSHRHIYAFEASCRLQGGPWGRHGRLLAVGLLLQQRLRLLAIIIIRIQSGAAFEMGL